LLMRRACPPGLKRTSILLCLGALAGGCADVTVVADPTPTATVRACVSPDGVAKITFSRTKYPNIRRHYAAAVRDGWPRVLTLRRAGADLRRDRALAGIATRAGMDRDEYPPAVGRGSSRTDVAYVPSSENRSHGSVLGLKLRRFCDGTRFRYVFY
jgi:hypothetical protein